MLAGPALRRWGPASLLLALPLLANWQGLTGWLEVSPRFWLTGLLEHHRPGLIQGTPGWLDPNAGFTAEALGRLAAEQWSEGRVPWWNPFSGVGVPLAGEMQPAALFLPFILLHLLPNGLLLMKVAMQMVAGLAAWGVLRALGLGGLAALAGAAAFELNGTFATYSYGPAYPVAFLPLLLLGIERARAARTRGSGVALAAAAIAWSLAAGFPETAYIDGLLALAWASWRFVGLERAGRAGFAAAVAGGGVLGLLTAAPALWSFAHSMLHGVTAGRGFAGIDMPAPGFSVLVFPFIFGANSSLTVHDSSGAISLLGAFLGGYLGVPVLSWALLALAGQGPRPHRALRWLLAGWIAACLGRTFGVPGVSHLVNAVPLIDLTQFYRYAAPSWEFAACVLAALALDDWRRGEAPSRSGRLVMLALVLCAVAAGLAAATPTALALLHAVPAYPAYFAASLAWAAAGLGLTWWFAARTPTPRRAGLLAALLVLESTAVFNLPLWSGFREARLDLQAVAFLRDNLGLQRFYTLAPFRANYGAFYGVASINHEVLPVPSVWADYVLTRLDPTAHEILFRGDYPPGMPSHQEALRQRLPAYKAMGVRYVLTQGPDPSARLVAAPTGAAGNQAQPLTAGQGLAGGFPAGLVQAGRVEALKVQIATYGGAATGQLSATLCGQLACAAGRIALPEAADNADATIALRPPLDVAAGERLRWTIRHDDGAQAAAVWLWPDLGATQDVVGPGGPLPGLAPRIALDYAAGQARMRLAYRSPVVSIWEVPDPAPYFEAIGGPCRLAPAGRETVATSCDAPATLVRRELFYPGWHAAIDGREAAITRAEPLFQSVALPAGEARIRFRYWPPFTRATYVLSALGLLGIGLASYSAARRRC